MCDYCLGLALMVLRVCACDVIQPFHHQLWSVTVSMGFVCRLDEAVRRIAGHSSRKSSAQKGGETEFGKNVSRNELVER